MILEVQALCTYAYVYSLTYSHFTSPKMADPANVWSLPIKFFLALEYIYMYIYIIHIILYFFLISFCITVSSYMAFCIFLLRECRRVDYGPIIIIYHYTYNCGWWGRRCRGIGLVASPTSKNLMLVVFFILMLTVITLYLTFPSSYRRVLRSRLKCILYCCPQTDYYLSGSSCTRKCTLLSIL